MRLARQFFNWAYRMPSADELRRRALAQTERDLIAAMYDLDEARARFDMLVSRRTRLERELAS